jgi:predicted transcriptional regulator
VPAFLEKMHGAVANLSSGAPREVEAPAQTEYTPAVTARRSLSSKDHIISLIDGKPYKTLKRHLSGHGLTPAQYRERYSLKADYPMVAESYAEMRRVLAKTIGLGRKPGTKVVAKPDAQVAAKPSAKVPAKAAVKAAVKPAKAKTAGRKPKAAAPEVPVQS